MKVDSGMRALERHISTTHEGHYVHGDVETIDTIAEIPGTFLGYTIGNVVKYISRFPTTRNKVDLLKACHYLLMLYQATPDPEPEVVEPEGAETDVQAE